MIELKIKGNEVSVVVNIENDEFLTECTAAVHALAGAISEKEGVSQSVALKSLCVVAEATEGVSQSVALKSLCVVAEATEDIFDTHRHRTVVRMPKGVKRNADD